MADNDIIKALEEWIKALKDDYKRLQALDAPMDCFEESHTDNIRILSNALDLINRKNTEIDYLRKEYIPMLEKNLKSTDKLGMEYMTESARLQAEVEKLQKLLDDKCDRCIAKDRAEAVKEFAERLKGLMLSKYCVYFNAEITEVLIDNLVKEMTEPSILDKKMAGVDGD